MTTARRPGPDPHHQRTTHPRQPETVIRRHPADKHDTLALWERVRVLHANLSAYDAQYVALAESLGAPLVTCDARIKRSGAAKCTIEVFSSN